MNFYIRKLEGGGVEERDGGRNIKIRHILTKLKSLETTKSNEKPINNEKEAPVTTRPISGDKTTRPPRNRINLIDRKAASKIFQAATRDIKISAKNS